MPHATLTIEHGEGFEQNRLTLTEEVRAASG